MSSKEIHFQVTPKTVMLLEIHSFIHSSFAQQATHVKNTLNILQVDLDYKAVQLSLPC